MYGVSPQAGNPVLIQRMELLWRVLADVIAFDKPFDITEWFAEGSDESDTENDPYDCGTAACAAGWLCRDPEARSLGLEVNSGEPFYQGMIGFGAIQRFFNANARMIDFIFYSDSYETGRHTTAKDVRDRVRGVLENGGVIS